LAELIPINHPMRCLDSQEPAESNGRLSNTFLKRADDDQNLEKRREHLGNRVQALLCYAAAWVVHFLNRLPVKAAIPLEVE
jgi:hypothetical protein